MQDLPLPTVNLHNSKEALISICHLAIGQEHLKKCHDDERNSNPLQHHISWTLGTRQQRPNVLAKAEYNYVRLRCIPLL